MSAPRPIHLWLRCRLAVFIALAGGTLAVFALEMLRMLQINGLNAAKIAIFLLFVILTAPITLSFWTGVIGFVARWLGRDSFELRRNHEGTAPADFDSFRTVVVIPVYNEDPMRVLAGLKASYESVEQTGLLRHFEFFILSDTTDPDVWLREEMAFMDLRQSVSDPGRIFYRNRRENVDRKMGNIADFCADWGGRYRYMVIFDADSVMTGNCLVDLVRLMEAHPEAGIIQAPPLPVNRHTFFGRMRQFATHAYSPIFLAGLNFWQGGAANYWGHNAIIRIQPFVEHCRLPKLPGREPLGGSILSHDFVEAAFMRRAGWRVYLAGELRGSYEEVPPSLISYAGRDRRWCQGNLQHSRLLFTPGLHLINRLHLCLGVTAYLAAPLWMLMLLISTYEGIREKIYPHRYFPAGPSLFPTWQISVQSQALWLFLAVMGLLMTPKLLSLMSCLRDRKERAGFGGGGKLALSVLIETIASTLLAPVLAFLQSHFVVGILMGKNVRWDAQDRGEPETTFGEAFKRHWPSTTLGIVWSVLLLTTAPRLFWWFSPVLAGFILAIPISVLTSRVSLGEWARRRGLFLTPEEADPPTIMTALDRELQTAETHSWEKYEDALQTVLVDPKAREVHLSLLGSDKPKDEMRKHYLEGLELKYKHGGSSALAAREKRELLLDGEAIRELLADNSSETPSPRF